MGRVIPLDEARVELVRRQADTLPPPSFWLGRLLLAETEATGRQVARVADAPMGSVEAARGHHGLAAGLLEGAGALEVYSQGVRVDGHPLFTGWHGLLPPLAVAVAKTLPGACVELFVHENALTGWGVRGVTAPGGPGDLRRSARALTHRCRRLRARVTGRPLAEIFLDPETEDFLAFLAANRLSDEAARNLDVRIAITL